MKIIVCGGRDFGDESLVRQTLDGLHFSSPINEVIHGGCSGVDSLADRWAILRGIKVTRIEADWNRHGKAAGPIRNEMMASMCPDIVIAFPGGRGTQNMINAAKRKGIKVIEVKISQMENNEAQR